MASAIFNFLFINLINLPLLEAKCLFRGECSLKSNLLGEVAVPCVLPHDPHKLDDEEALVTLRKICPEFFRDTNDPDLCCDADQVFALESNFQVPTNLGLGRCPSCSYNWRLNFCELTCSPRQSSFIEIKKTSEEGERRQVEEVDYFVSHNYATELFKSCQGVQGLSAGQTLLDLTCGQWGAFECTAQRWLNFHGLSIENNGQSPFQIDYVIDNFPARGDIIPMNEKTFKCSEIAPGSNVTCSCSDCEESCSDKNSSSETPKLSLFLVISSLFVIYVH